VDSAGFDRQNVPDSLLKCSANVLERQVGPEPIALHPVGLDLRFLPVCKAGSQGAVAQLGERLICIQEVAGSIPTSSTSIHDFSGPVAQLVRAHP
jgi:hypothetical protein